MPKKLKNKRYYQFTAIDCASRWRYLKVYDEYSKHNVVDFLKEVKLIKFAKGKLSKVQSSKLKENIVKK